ncbi:MAG: type II toxin-antitoxin system VapC family toxin [Tepidisphaerales bacterium]
MKAVFADSFYFLALLNADDEAHQAAAAFAGDPGTRFVTTAWILTEVADGLAKSLARTIFADLLRDLDTDPQAELISADPDLWRRGCELYAQRTDKKWSLTDWISFVVMADNGIVDALTADHHFAQAGFNPILKA